MPDETFQPCWDRLSPRPSSLARLQRVQPRCREPLSKPDIFNGRSLPTRTWFIRRYYVARCVSGWYLCCGTARASTGMCQLRAAVTVACLCFSCLFPCSFFERRSGGTTSSSNVTRNSQWFRYRRRRWLFSLHGLLENHDYGWYQPIRPRTRTQNSLAIYVRWFLQNSEHG